MKKIIVVFILLFISCSEEISLREFLFQYPDITIQINNGTSYDRNTNLNTTELESVKGQILTINKNGVKQEIYLKKWQKIRGTHYSVKPGG
jgi:hypothetical protein